MTQLSNLRVDQVGSLLRPMELLEVLGRWRSGEVGDEEWRLVQDDAIRKLIARQEEHDLPVLTDGEYRRVNFQDGFAGSVAGLERNPSMMSPPPGWAPGVYARVTGRLRPAGNKPLDEWRFAAALTDRPVKITTVGPGQVALRVDVPEGCGYQSKDELVADVAAIQRGLLQELAKAGCPYLQVDAPSYSEYLDEGRMQRTRARGEDTTARLERDLTADNALVEGINGPVVAIHLCRGNFANASFLRTGGYDAIAERMFGTLAHQRFLLEYDTERAGGFEPLRFVPKGKTVVLGLVTTKQGTLEDPDEIKRRIDEASRFVPLEQLALSPQCGFATAVRPGARGAMTEDEQWRKLDLVRQVAAEVWGA